MKEPLFIEMICNDFCCYYKSGREELKCGGYRFLTENLTLHELYLLNESVSDKELARKRVPKESKELFEMVCANCDFLVDGCDYRDGVAAPPCGGYIMLDQLLNIE